jgi:alpha-glucosidase
MEPWWREAVVYQVYPRSFACARNPSGVGDLRGIVARLDHIVDLGVDAIWLSPVFHSPMADHGYDVSGYCDIDPLFGTMADFEDLLAAAHARGVRVLLDMVPNHTSDQHPWFTAAVAAGRGSRSRRRYLFRDGRGDLPPTDVVSSFGGGPVWTRVAEPDGSPGQWYFHLFAAEQPDLDWTEPQVLADFEGIWRFWLDKGVDGFRVDVADHLTKDVDRTDVPEGNQLLEHDADNRTHRVWRAFRRLLDGYSPPRAAVGEIWAEGDARALYCRSDEFPSAFAFGLLKAGWDAGSLRSAIDGALRERGALGAAPAWVIDNHDTPRSATRLGPGAVGLARSRALTQVMLALPGSVYLYQGQELGLPNVDALPDDVLQDPIWVRSGFTDRGRDGCRVPLPWSGDSPPFGFAPAGVPTWLPQPDTFAEYTVDGQTADPASTLRLVRRLVHLRRGAPELRGGSLAWLDCRPDLLHFERQADTRRCRVLMNLGDVALPLPDGEVLAASGELTGGLVPPDTTVWMRPGV